MNFWMSRIRSYKTMSCTKRAANHS